jgi:capsular polysaccharide biosynthesis protein
LNLAAGLVLALGFGLGVAYTQEQYDPRIYSAVAISEATGLDVIGSLQDFS